MLSKKGQTKFRSKVELKQQRRLRIKQNDNRTNEIKTRMKLIIKKFIPNKIRQKEKNIERTCMRLQTGKK